MGIEKKPQMEAEEAFKLDVVRVKLVKEAPLYSELPLQNPYEAAATIGEFLCEMDREVVCVVNLQSDLKPINVTFASIGALNEALVHPREILKATLSLVCYTRRYFRSCIIRQTLTVEEDSRFMSHLCLTSSPMSHCRMTTVPCFPPCEAGKSVRLSLYRTLHS